MLRLLFPNLLDPALDKNLRADSTAALVGTLTSIPQTLAYGLIIGSALGGDYSGIGILAALYGSVLVGLAAVLLGGSPFLVTGPRAATVLVMAALIVDLKHAPALAGLAEPALAAFGLACAAAAGAGLLQVAFATLRFGRLAHYVPLPVVAGFINGSALLIIFSQVWAATGVARQTSVLDLFAHWSEIRPATLLLAAATAALVLFLPRVIKRGPVMLLSVLLANMIYHVCAALGCGAACGGTLPPLPSSFEVGFIGDDVAHLLSGAHGGELLRLMLPPAVSMAILSSLDTLLATAAADELTRRHSPAGRQLLAEGGGNLAAALFSMAPGSSSMIRTQATLRAGMVSAAAPIGIALLTLVMTVAFGSALALLSQAVMAGLLLALGIDLFDKWTLARVRALFDQDGATRAVGSDLLIVVAVVAVTLAANLATAVAVGMLVALVSFVVQMAHSPVRRCYRATALLPRIHGDLIRRNFIERHGRAIAIVELEGALFFGSTADLKRQIEALIDTGVTHVALDLKRVKNIDATGARTLERIHHALAQRGGLLTVGYIERERRASRQKNRPSFKPRRLWVKLVHYGSIHAIGDRRFFPDIDAAVAACEAHLAQTLPRDAAVTARADLRAPLLRGIDRSMLRRLRPYLSRLAFAPGAQVFAQGGAPDAVFLLAAGRVDVVLDLPGTDRKLKVQSLSAGSVFGEMALIDPQPRSAGVVAQEATRCYCLSADALTRLKREQSDIAFALLANIAVIFAERLRATNNMLAEMDA
ncbi:MAG: SLC26A/SulP transporter family protein [Rhodocyclales bacterium]|nr:SLC26A/SulP transporter family protein [Rhodocyclales bacterium]